MPPKKSAKGQTSISSFFSKDKGTSSSRKRNSSPIDLTLDESELTEPPPKRVRREEHLRDENLPVSDVYVPPAKTALSPAAKRWCFVPPERVRSGSNDVSMEPDDFETTADELRAKQERRLAFRDKLLGKANLTRPPSSEGTPSLAPSEADEAESEDESESDNLVKSLHGKYASQKRVGKNDLASQRVKSKKKEEIGPSGLKYTPLENQIRKLKAENEGTLLLVEVGYKYRFFGDDAKIASKELGIACFPNRNFLSASIPVHRRNVHVKKLLSQGYKVGIVGQTETAALKKAGDNRNAPFEREVTNLYTAATFIDELDALDDVDNHGQGAAPALMCLIEQLRGGMGVDERVLIGMVSVVPSTGDITYDEFEDSHMRTELETRLSHLKPCELLLPEKKLSKSTEKMLHHLANHGTTHARFERFKDQFTYSDAFEFLSEFYTKSDSSTKLASDSFKSGKLMASVVDLPKTAIVALAQTLKHLTAFGLASVFLRTDFFTKFLSRAHMLVNGNTLSNLEIYRNQTDQSEKGSLIWVLDHTKTKFGSRLLRSWVGRPLVDKALLQERVDAVEEILEGGAPPIITLQELLRKLPDLVKGLCRIQYGKCTPKELASLLPALNDVASAFKQLPTPNDVGLKSPLLNSIVFSLPSIKGPIQCLLGAIDIKMAKNDQKEDLWLDPNKYPAIEETKLGILAVESELEDHLRTDIRPLLKKPSLAWTAVSGVEYLIEVTIAESKKIPLDWSRISSTKRVMRYHTPIVRQKIAQRDQLKETLKAEADNAFSAFLQEISEHYSELRDVINKVAIADCLMSLAAVALQPGYSKPIFVDDDSLKIVNGRHPMVENLHSDPYVPSSITLNAEEKRNRIITGPNMGGKSCCVRMIALIAMMAQVGSYVPADSGHVSLHDGILTRMGASDEIAQGRSTFMVEMAETSDILRTATPRTLVILDELGRGTSTFDGMAIADSVLSHLVKTIRCKTLFITHYSRLAAELEIRLPDVANSHMGYVEDKSMDGTSNIHFLYTLEGGIATRSFGVECARLAGIPDRILHDASERGLEMRNRVEARITANRKVPLEHRF